MAGLKYIGQSIKFPLVLVNGKPIISDSSETIKESIYTLLSTEKGSRFMLPEYGSRLSELLFEPNDEIVKDLLEVFVLEAIEEFENRVRFIGITFNQGDEDKLDCYISYEIKQLSEIDTMVFPFYRKIKY